jgi:hypothetical protein
LLLALDGGIDALDRIADGDEFVLRLLPLTVVDQLLHLLKLGRSQRDLFIAGRLVLAEDRGPHAVERVAGSGAVDGRAKTTDAQDGRRHGSDDRERSAGAAVVGQAALQGFDGVARGDGHGDR